MRLSLGLDQRQVQKQVQTLAPRMIQSMEILQLPILALQERIEQELNENPVLDMVEPEATPTEEEEAAEERVNPDAPTEDERELVVDVSKGDNADDFERLLNLDREVPDYFDESPRRSANRMDEEADRKHDAMSNLASRPQSLQDHLLLQLAELEELPIEVSSLAQRIISTLDPKDGGYFRSSLMDLLPPDAGPERMAHAQRALEVVQSLDPPGIAARDLRECLLLQLSADMPYYDELKVLISGHLEDLRDNRLPAIERVTGFSISTIQAAWNQS